MLYEEPRNGTLTIGRQIETGELSKVGDLLSWDAVAKVQLHDHSEQTEAVPELYPSCTLATGWRRRLAELGRGRETPSFPNRSLYTN